MKDSPPTPDRVLKVAVPMVGAAEAAAALGASLRLRRDSMTVEPELAARLDGVLDALGLRGAVDALDRHETTALLGILEGSLAQAADFVVEPARDGWDHENASVLMAQGHSSALIADVLQRFVVPSLSGLRERLGCAGASFLDVGVGVAALSVAMCRLWPPLRVVGIDPWGPELALARKHVAGNGLEKRIELRRSRAETLEDADEYDLAWVPTFFIPGAVLEQTIERVHDALRPGGWVTVGLYARPGNPLMDALADLRTVRQGGSVRTPQQLALLLKQTGFHGVGVHFDAAWALPIVHVAGQRRMAP